jgi:hypothetical protein
MDQRVLARVCREIGVPDLVERLSSRVSPSDLQAVLLELARRRTARRSPADIVEQYRRDGAVLADSQDARALGRLAMAAFDAVPTYEAVELSPVEPLGVNTVLAGLDQTSILATARATEVVADPTVALALHAAVRRRGELDPVRMCACHRVLRPQASDPSARRHFRLFALVSATRSQADHVSEVEAMREHVQAHIAIAAAAREMGALIDRLVVRVSDTDVHRALVAEEIAVKADVTHPRDAMPNGATRRLGRRLRRLEAAVEALMSAAEASNDTRVLVDLTRTEGVNYYDGLQLRIDAVHDGVQREVADGGSVDWMAKLLSDRHEQLFTSGAGLERLRA